MKRAPRVVALLGVSMLLLVGAACRSGVKTSVGVDADGRIIFLGELSPFSGGVEVIGEPLTNGHRVYFEYVNKDLGGVGRDLADDEKYQVELVERDTKYDPQVHAQQYAAVKDQVLLIAQSLGTPTTQAILPQINSDGILTGAATLSSQWLREKYVVPAGAPYPVQFINAASYIVNDLGKTPKAGIIYQDDEYGEEGLKGLEFAADKLGFEIVARATYKPSDTEFVTQVTAMARAGADHVFLTTVPTQALTITGTAAQAGYAPQWIGQSPTWIGAFTAVPHVQYLQQTYWLVTDGACSWGEVGAGCEGMKEMLDNVQKYAPDQKPDIYFQFGYTQARIIHQILEKAIADGDLTREGVVAAFESLENADMGGLLNDISYGDTCEEKIPATASTISAIDPAEPAGLRTITKVDADIVADFPFCD
ncbi:MAG TPA: ABC transporter substrate-binding protein [Actinomycetota bacterium]